MHSGQEVLCLLFLELLINRFPILHPSPQLFVGHVLTTVFVPANMGSTTITSVCFLPFVHKILCFPITKWALSLTSPIFLLLPDLFLSMCKYAINFTSLDNIWTNENEFLKITKSFILIALQSPLQYRFMLLFKRVAIVLCYCFIFLNKH